MATPRDVLRRGRELVYLRGGVVVQGGKGGGGSALLVPTPRKVATPPRESTLCRWGVF